MLAITRRIDSNVACVRWGTWSHVRLRRAMGAVPNAEIIDVNVEKLFRERQRYCQSAGVPVTRHHIFSYSRQQQKRSA